MGSMPKFTGLPCFLRPGASIQPSPATFAYDEEAYKKALGEFIDAAPFAKPVVLIVQVPMPSADRVCISSL